jgi:hypothetical protein
MKEAFMDRRLSAVLFALITVIALPPGSHVCAGTQSPRAACEALSGITVPASAIGLPTGGAAVRSALLISDEVHGEFCKVLGGISPRDPKAPNINFQLNLPSNWNGKAIQFGGGGTDGVVITGLTSRFPLPNSPTPVRQGYATFGSDSGHAAPPNKPYDATFALNDESFANFGGDQLKKTRDAAAFLISSRYGKAPHRFYFQGGSQGGHEILLAMQRWPSDYDGVIVIFPVYAAVALQLDTMHIAQAIYTTPGAWCSPAKMNFLYSAVMKCCDGLDGLDDGVISNVKACAQTFKLNGLRCADGSASSCMVLRT